jgi:hydroxyethylthiazole kinase-like uncharacterized protein yjeF
MPSPRAEPPLDAATLRMRFPLPDDAGDDKYVRGTVLVIGGSAATPGAVVLAGIAALRVGAGRLQIATDARCASAVAVRVPEALVLPFDDRRAVAEQAAAAGAVVIGPGLTDAAHAASLLAVVVAAARCPVVVDARALEALAAEPMRRPASLVLTPNEPELRRLLGQDGDDVDDVDDEHLHVAAARRFGAAVIAERVVADPSGCTWRDPQPVSGLGTSGSGDVLAGAAGGLAARTADAAAAACWAALAHREAGRRLARRIGPSGYLASELADELAPVVGGFARG